MDSAANSQKVTSSYYHVLGIGAFRNLWIAQIFSQFAVNSLLFVLALRLYQTTESNTTVSGLFLAYGVPALLFGLMAGTAVDHLDKRRLLFYCDLFRAGLVISLFFITHPFYVYGIMFLNAIVTQFYFPAEAPMIPKIVPGQHLVTANSLFTVTFYMSLAVGSIAAGPLLRVFGDTYIFIILALLFIGAAWFNFRLPSMAEGVLGFRTVLFFNISYIFRRMWQKLMEGLRYIRSSKVLYDSILLLTGTQIIFMMLGTLGPGFAHKALGIDVRDVSLYVVGPAVVGILMGAVWVGNFGYRYRPGNLINAGVLWAGGMLIIIAITTGYFRVPLLLSSFMFFLLGFANSLLDIPANSLLQQEASGLMRGRVYGMLTALVGGVGIIPVITGGVIADTLGTGYVILFLGMLIFTYGLVRMKKNVKQLFL